MRGVGRIAALAVLVIAFVGLFDLVGLTSGVLLGALIGALVFTLVLRQALPLPEPLYVLGQAILGASIGASVDLETITALGADWSWVLLVSVATIAVSVALGLMLCLRGEISRETAVFASVAGGAAGLSAMSRDLGADDRVVTVLQYLRIVVIVASLPLVVEFAFRAPDSGGIARASAGEIVPALAFTTVSIALGVVGGRLVRLPAGPVLGPLVAAAAVHPLFGAVGVPSLVEQSGYLLIGLAVGLRFTRGAVRTISRLLPLAVANVVVVIVVCAVMGAGLAHVTGESALDGYLATTPGGFSAVLAIASTTGGNLTFVTASQLVRLLLILALAPAFGAWLRRRA
ncbi:AbrB family transcriptional regulator [Aeromicrobium phragmitis]|uniref:AbrB family transcriptional regulator n=1 Tax=Aeromicrobium phragmitis TaxID=2478914 RepID=A0A3L8PJF4_9ACTN|nr:AbrB family transcriptional regulator [Aeromicrobium phragmitis]RLV55324.1 AbrB family transcriptional regulator [Aeromicrobium phragmitis]